VIARCDFCPVLPLPVLIPKRLGLGFNKTRQHLCYLNVNKLEYE
jgi:hypothetical protein